ncbi:hypothetical protein F4821DRAFT_168260 [Hypoxylon rubiginosum]|uniref:Uncharacterized protein n=1 Tax=Hypoxylon rubiginosum TaxID=110542 RepID=A0ACC0CW84_9PEZI|nr:hypothetical protein F4821DRAFT_168260 [Hypoxylon rubiginosum]
MRVPGTRCCSRLTFWLALMAKGLCNQEHNRLEGWRRASSQDWHASDVEPRRADAIGGVRSAATASQPVCHVPSTIIGYLVN